MVQTRCDAAVATDLAGMLQARRSEQWWWRDRKVFCLGIKDRSMKSSARLARAW